MVLLPSVQGPSVCYNSANLASRIRYNLASRIKTASRASLSKAFVICPPDHKTTCSQNERTLQWKR